MKMPTAYIPVLFTKEDYDNAQVRAIELVRNSDKSELEKSELHALKLLIKDWEKRNFPEISDVDPVDYIQWIMEENGLRHTDMISYFGTSSRVTEVLARRRKLTLGMIRKLNEGLGIPFSILIRESRMKKQVI